MGKLVSGKPSLIKEINRNNVFKLIIKHGEISRSKLSKMAGLALPSIMRIVDRLIEDGLIIETGKGDSTGGRKPSLLQLKQDAMYFIGIEIGLNIGLVLTDLAGNIIDQRLVKDIEDLPPEKILFKAKHALDDLLVNNKKYNALIKGIGVGTPGRDFKYQRDIKHAVSRGWQSVDVAAWFKKYYHYEIIVENIARTRTLGEMWFGEGRNYRDFIYVFVDRGVGCGIVQGGVIREGVSGVAGEFGHSVISIDGRPCYCGNDGCLEMYVSAGAIINSINDAHDQSFESYSEVLTFLKHQDGDHLNQISKYLGVGIGNLINILNPQVVVLGGIVSTDTPGIKEGLEREIKRNIFNGKAEDTNVVISGLSGENTILGSVALVINSIFKSVVI